MAVGTVAEGLNLSVLPDGLTFTVTSLENQATGSWSSYLGGRKPPFTVAAGKNVVESRLSTSSVTNSGPGPSNKVRFQVSGDVNGRSFSKNGYFLFSTTDWPLIGRPDYSILTFQLDGTDAVSIYQSIPRLITPDPYYFSFAVNNDQLLLVASRENNLGTVITGKIIEGIITAHTKALGWVFGKIW